MRKIHPSSQKIIALKTADLTLRERLLKSGALNDGYNPEMESLHLKNAEILNEIVDRIGYPTSEKVGEKAADAAWLVIQHAISRPDFMRRCLSLLEAAVSEYKANPQHLAYLSDRIAVFEGRPQRYGTQFDWDEQGELGPNTIDDLRSVNRRREAIGLNTLEEQTLFIRTRAKEENEFPPTNHTHRLEEMQAWKQRVGWIK